VSKRSNAIVTPIVIHQATVTLPVFKRANEVEGITILAKRENIIFADSILPNLFTPERVRLTLAIAVAPAIVQSTAIIALLARVNVKMPITAFRLRTIHVALRCILTGITHFPIFFETVPAKLRTRLWRTRRLASH
jgi:hypothetical protein